jgi:hypothetical protein
MNAVIFNEINHYKEERKNNYKSKILKINTKQIMEMSALGSLLEIPLRD